MALLSFRKHKGAGLLVTPPLPLLLPVSGSRAVYLRSALSVPSLLLLGSSSPPKIASLALSISPLSSSRSPSGSLLAPSLPGGASSSVLGKTSPAGTSSVTAPSPGGTLPVLGGASSLLGRAPSSIPDILGGGTSSVVGGTSGSTRCPAPPIPGSLAAASISGRPRTLPVVSSLIGAPAARPT